MKTILFSAVIALPFTALANEKVEIFKKQNHFNESVGSWSVQVTYPPMSEKELGLISSTYDKIIASSENLVSKEANKKFKKEAVEAGKKKSKFIFDVMLSGKTLFNWEYYRKAQNLVFNTYAKSGENGMGVRVNEAIMELMVTDDPAKLLLDLNKVTTLSLRLNEALKKHQYKVTPIKESVRIDFQSKGYKQSYLLNEESTSVVEFTLTKGNQLKKKITLDNTVWNFFAYKKGKVSRSETWTPSSPLPQFNYQLDKHTHNLYRCSATISSIRTDDLSIDDVLQLLGKENE